MRYLITTNTHPPFFTDWFDSENNFNPEIGMVVYDLATQKFTNDGLTWNTIFIDHL